MTSTSFLYHTANRRRPRKRPETRARSHTTRFVRSTSRDSDRSDVTSSKGVDRTVKTGHDDVVVVVVVE